MAYHHRHGCACWQCEMERTRTRRLIEVVEGETVDRDEWYDLDPDVRMGLANQAIENLDSTLVRKHGLLAIEVAKDPAVAAEVEARRRCEEQNRLADKLDEVALAEQEYRHALRVGAKGAVMIALGWVQVLVGVLVVDSAALAWVGGVMAVLFFAATGIYLSETKLTTLRKDLNTKRLEYGRMERRS